MTVEPRSDVRRQRPRAEHVMWVGTCEKKRNRTLNFTPFRSVNWDTPGSHRGHGMVWYGMVDVCDGYLAAEASGSSFG